MAVKLYVGDAGGIARQVKKLYVGDANGVAREVKTLYAGDGGGAARKVYEKAPPAPLYQLGKDWWEASVPNTSASSEGCTNIAYGAGRFVAFGTPGSRAVRYSFDGTTWYDSANALPQTAVGVITQGLRYLDGTFLLAVNAAQIYRSVDGGVKWSSVTTPKAYCDFALGNGRIVAVGASGAAYSTDYGKLWTASSNYISGAKRVAFGGGRFIALGSPLKGGYSTDGVTWTSFDTFSHYCTNLIYAGGKFVAVSDNSKTIFYSNDGITWFEAINTGTRLKSIAYGDGVYLATQYASSDTIFCSTDAITWEGITLPLKATWYGVAFGNHAFVLLADGSTKAPQALFSRATGPAV